MKRRIRRVMERRLKAKRLRDYREAYPWLDDDWYNTRHVVKIVSGKWS